MDRCEVKRCRAEADITYLSHGVCTKHWDELSSEDAPPDALRLALGLPVAHDVKEHAMDDGSRKSAKKQAATARKEAATENAAEIAMEVRGSKAANKQRSAKAAAPKKEKAPREKVENPVVFAFRLSEADRTRIHDAAGPAGATRFVRSAALAAATGDTKAFETLVTQAKSNLK